MSISVILCTYNRVNSLKLAVESVLSQSNTDFEFIIVNDASSDDTADYLKTLEAKDTITVISNEINLGLQASLNIAMHRAKGDYIARIDDDDEWIDEHKLEEQLALFMKTPNLVLVGTAYRIGDDVFYNPSSDEEIRNQILFRCPFQHSTVMFKRMINGKKVLYSEHLPYSEDWDLWLSLGAEGRLLNLDVVTTSIGQGDNLSEEYFVKQLPINRNLCLKYKHIYPRKNLALIYHQFLSIFFVIFPINGRIHRGFQHIFKVAFRL